MNTKTDNTFDDPFGVRVLVFKVRWNIMRGKKVQKVVEIVLVSNPYR